MVYLFTNKAIFLPYMYMGKIPYACLVYTCAMCHTTILEEKIDFLHFLKFEIICSTKLKDPKKIIKRGLKSIGQGPSNVCRNRILKKNRQTFFFYFRAQTSLTSDSIGNNQHSQIDNIPYIEHYFTCYLYFDCRLSQRRLL